MPDEPQSRSAMERSARRLAREIESRVFRNALDEEQRAQKALYLLRARDRRIAFLEKRVAELEDVAGNLHEEITLRNSSRSSILERGGEPVVSDFSRSGRSSRTGNCDDAGERSNCNLEDVDSTRFDDVGSSRGVPTLRLSLSSSSREISSTAIDLLLEKRKRFASDVEDAAREDPDPDRKSVTKAETADSEKFVDTDEESNREGRSGRDGREDEIRKGECLTVSVGKGSSCDKRRGSSFPRRHGFRKKPRGCELKSGKRMKELSSGDGQTLVPFRTTERGSTNRRQGGGEMMNGGKRTERETKNREQSGRSTLADAQETRPVADKRIDTKTRTICTQTSTEAVQSNEKNLHDEATTDANHFGPSSVYLKQKQSSVFCIDEDPAPQWLIEEALARGTERIEQRTKGKISPNKEAENETIMSDLKAKLSRTKEDLEDALKAKFIVKEKYKRLLENARTEARKESEVLQENIVRICTSVLENFGPRSMDRRRTACYQIKSHRKLKCHQRITNKLRRKLKTAMTKSNKLKRKLATTRKKLRNKSEEYESISKCFDQLKQEMEATETNLNDLISENLSLKRKMDETRDWLEHTVGKQHHAGHFRDACKNRELSNLKKKVEEDSATIAQLRNKLVRLESTNANKGFLLNSYKAQLTDLSKEKNQLLSKVNSLENEISNTRNGNSQLRAKILVLNNEKDRLLLDNENSKTDIKEKMEMQYAKKCEKTVQLEIETIKNKYEETIKFMETKLLAAKTQNVEYLNAIKEFLKKLYEQRNDREAQKSNESEAGEKETRETICNILNMTPDELSGFINGKIKNSINPWIVELNRIISTNQFSKDLSKFLLRKMTKKTKM